VDTFFVSVHAVAATVAFAAGLAALRDGRLVRLHLAAVVLMAAALVPAVLVDWATTPVGARVAFAALSVLALVMVVRATLAVRGRPQVTGGPTAGYLAHVGFGLIALADGFAVVASIRAGLPGYAIAALALGVVAAGHVGVGVLQRRLVGSLVAV
jgi:hypothetical protein